MSYISRSGREIKPVLREEYLNEEEFDQFLMDEFRLTPEELEEDLYAEHHYSLQHGVIMYEGKGIPMGPDEIIQWLQEVQTEVLFAIWQDPGNRKVIGNLLRYPGGQHEWLMVALVPYFKRMGIPLDWIREYRTPTDACSFTYYDEEGREEVGWHGEAGSGHMHFCLKNYFLCAYKHFLEEELEEGEGLELVADCLELFMEEFYPEWDEEDIPQALPDLIEALRDRAAE